MPNSGAFEPVLSAKALGLLHALSKPKQRRLIGLLFRLAEQPDQVGDYQSRDDTGREVQHLLIGDLVVSFWPDHAVKELRIVEIEEI
ncbi:MAG: hypothetical protein KIT44_14910 [Opitutaceae bacterium]|nr:hypothetical protein [Opitutaceae bacterium]